MGQIPDKMRISKTLQYLQLTMKTLLTAVVLCMSFGLSAMSAPMAAELDLSEGLDRRPVPKKAFVQPPAIAKEFAPLMKGTLEQRLAALKKKAKRDFVFIKGGTFMMGDFGRVHSPEELYYTGQFDNKPLHEVTLSSFSLSRFKVTFLEFDLYSEATRTEKVAQEDWMEDSRKPLHPAEAVWQGAKNYCQWLGKLTGLPIDLPTEAQWEYAARNRGKFVLFPTQNGEYRPGYNLSHFDQRKKYGTSLIYPVGIFPQTPLGLFDMAENSGEWMQDWYDEDYYEHSPKLDPNGPTTGTEKVIRTRANVVDRYVGLTIWRSKSIPETDPERPFGGRSGVRCAVHSAQSVNY